MELLLDYKNISVFISLLVYTGLLWVLYRYGRKTPGGKAYAVAILAIMVWIFPMVLYRSDFMGEMLLWVRILYAMATFTSTTFFIFTVVFPDNKKMSWRLQIFLLLENVAIIFLCFHPTFIIQGVEVVLSQEPIILWGPLYFLFSLHISGWFLAGFVILFKKYIKATGIVKKQILYILIGYFIGSNLAMITNLVLPWFGYFELNWLGQFFSTFLAIFTTYAILRLNLLDIKLVTAEGLLIILNLFLGFKFIFSSGLWDFILQGFLLFSVMVISYMLLRSVRKEIDRREELTKLAKTLEKANLRLQEVDRQKTEFLSIASHQLRTPLSIAKGYIELLEDGAYGKINKEMRNILEGMNNSNEHLVKLVDDFLDISRIEQGRTKYTFSDMDLNKLVEGVAEELKERAKEKGIKIIYKKLKIKNVINIDEEKVRHVVFNFIDNAIKYSNNGKKIIVNVIKEKKGISVRIKDDGLGFDKVDQANFFQKFYRGNNVKGTNVSGTGLGLYVCRRFIERHDGRIWADSKGKGKGSEFGFWIPSLINRKNREKE